MGPGMPAIVIVISMTMVVAVNVPLTTPSMRCGLVHATLYENWVLVWVMPLTLQSVVLSGGISKDFVPSASLAVRQRCVACVGRFAGAPGMFILIEYS